MLFYFLYYNKNAENLTFFTPQKKISVANAIFFNILSYKLFNNSSFASKNRMHRTIKQLRNNVVALWSQAGLRKFASRKMGCESVKKRMCLSMRRYGVPSSRGPWSSSLQGMAEVSLYAFGGHFLANLLQPGYFSLLRFFS